MSLRTQDPDFKAWSGTIKTDMEIGQGALVEIEATVDDDETTAHIVTYRGVDIADTLNDAGQKEIDRHISKHWRGLVHESEREAATEAA